MLFCCFATLLKEYNISSTTCQVMLNFLIKVKHFKFIFQNLSIYFALNLLNLLSKLSGKKLYAISTYRQTCMYIYQHTHQPIQHLALVANCNYTQMDSCIVLIKQ